MRLLITLLFLLFVFSCVSTKHQNRNDEFTAVNYVVHFPIVQADGKYFELNDTTSVYYYRDIVVYQLPYMFDSSEVVYHAKADSTSSKSIVNETRYHYFVCRQSNSNGIWYESVEKLDSVKIISVDSVFKSIGIFNNVYSRGDRPNDSLVETISWNNGNSFVKKYIPKAKSDEFYPDTTLLYFFKINEKYSISPFALL